MELKELQKNWHGYGKTDPLWAILTEPSKRFGRWDRDEFFKTGEEQIAQVIESVQALGLNPPRRKALDFGCGVGRLTQALCDHFEQGCGVDIAPSMIELANQYNRHGDRCRYFLNDVNDLHLFEDASFDFIYSYVVLQHMRPEYALDYIREFVRVLAPGGAIVFQLPCRRVSMAMPDSGFKAQLVLLNPPERLTAGEPTLLRVRVKNLSEVTWSATPDTDALCHVRLGDHWLDEQGNMITIDGSRSDMPDHLKPGEEVELAITVTPPSEPGRYLLELDMLQEGVSWFQSKGSETVRVAVGVEAAGPRRWVFHPEAEKHRPTGSDAEALVMQMYGIEEQVVSDQLVASGGKIVEVRRDVGGDWLHCRYCVTK